MEKQEGAPANRTARWGGLVLSCWNTLRPPMTSCSTPKPVMPRARGVVPAAEKRTASALVPLHPPRRHPRHPPPRSPLSPPPHHLLPTPPRRSQLCRLNSSSSHSSSITSEVRAGLQASVVWLVLGLGSGSVALTMAVLRSWRVLLSLSATEPPSAAMPAPNWSTGFPVKKEGRQAMRAAWPPLGLLGICILIPSLPERWVTAVSIAERLRAPLRLVGDLAGKAVARKVVPVMYHLSTSQWLLRNEMGSWGILYLASCSLPSRGLLSTRPTPNLKSPLYQFLRANRQVRGLRGYPRLFQRWRRKSPDV